MPSYTATRNRFEVKYLVDTRRIAEVTAALGDHAQPDPRSGPDGYRVFSIYWDSPGFALFWEKIEGLRDRRKFRIRRYGDSANVFLEIKARHDRTLHKSRSEWPLERVVRAFGDGSSLDWSLVEGDKAGTEAMMMVEKLNLAPRIGLLYRRRAYFGGYDPELRVTFDSRIVYRTRDLDISRPFRTGKYVLDPRVSVMEIKYNHRAPIWLTKLIRRHELRIVRMSKYCSAVDREYHRSQLT
jgi:SPX domain protein involved in polyphosphate accumulation